MPLNGLQLKLRKYRDYALRLKKVIFIFIQSLTSISTAMKGSGSKE